MKDHVLTARWLFPVDQPPLENGTITIRNGLIVAVHPAGARHADEDLGNAAIVPGFVNAHTHLDLSGMRGLVQPSSDFISWLRRVISHRRTRDSEEIQHNIRDGLAEAMLFGTTLLGDIAAGGASWDILANAPLRSVVFYELLGLPLDRSRAAWEGWSRWNAAKQNSENCRKAISPHAPYSTSAELMEAAVKCGVPLTIHLAECEEELELLEHHSGPFAGFLSNLGVWEPDRLAPSISWILNHAASAPFTLLAHGNYLPRDLDIPMHATVVYCPRTFDAFGRANHPFTNWLARGIRIALGTDSLASNPDLDPLAEAAFIHRLHPEVPAAALLQMVTLAGAEALGFSGITGSLTAGKSADLVVVPLPDYASTDSHTLLFDQVAIASPRRTMFGGK